ncbi:hypothetical protein ZEAMMB73_Zm00001d052870 [Zea mays]|uniref:Uncharacterized protein n=1 Tax=Zea mays TaxID=4577 RepID=K7V3D5_MAIZE|nr:hypothetical protein ZEAMMB73_Zm00001d052870 [Zea mays]
MLTASFLRFLLLLLLPLTALYFFYMLHLLLTSASSAASNCAPDTVSVSRMSANLTHEVFDIAALSRSRLWDKRKEYIKVWWRPRGAMRGYVWLDREVRESNMSTACTGLPAIRISSDTSAFPYTHRRGHRSAIRISLKFLPYMKKYEYQQAFLHGAVAKASEKDVKEHKEKIGDQNLEIKALRNKAAEWQLKVLENEGILNTKEKERDQRVVENNLKMNTLKSEVESEHKCLAEKEIKIKEKLEKDPFEIALHELPNPVYLGA